MCVVFRGRSWGRKALETLFQYSYEQGLAQRKLEIEDAFHPSTLKFAELA